MCCLVKITLIMVYRQRLEMTENTENALVLVLRSDLPSEYSEMMETEQHHHHEIVKDENGVFRWKEDPFICRLIDACSISNIIDGFHANGIDKNSEVFRELFRRGGYPLRGYWEIFYWEVNNEEAGNYSPPNH